MLNGIKFLNSQKGEKWQNHLCSKPTNRGQMAALVGDDVTLGVSSLHKKTHGEKTLREKMRISLFSKLFGRNKLHISPTC